MNKRNLIHSKYTLGILLFLGCSLLVSAQVDPKYFGNRPFPESPAEIEERHLAVLAELEEDRKYKSRAGNWKEIGPTQSTANYGKMGEYLHKRISGTGRIYFVEFDKERKEVFVGSPTGGLFYKGMRDDAFRTAGTDFLPNPGISHFQVDSEGNWYISTGDGDDGLTFSYGIFRSTDRGRSWEAINGSGEYALPFTRLEKSWEPVNIRKMFQPSGNPNILYAASTKGLYRSDNVLADNGSNVKWELKIEDEFYDIISRPLSSNQELYASGRSVYVSRNAGRDWEELAGIERTKLAEWKSYKRLRATIRISRANTDVIYVAINADDGQGSKRFQGHLYKFIISKEQWIDLGSLKKEAFGQRIMGAGRAQSFDVSPLDADRFIMGNVLSLWMSEDGGKSNYALTKSFHDDLHWACFGPDGNSIWIGTDGGVNVSYDNGKNWIDQTKGLGVANMFNLTSNERNHKMFLYGGYDTGNNLYTGKEPWYQVDFGDGFDTHIRTIDGKEYFYTATHSSLHKSDTSGAKERILPSSRDIGSQWKRQFYINEASDFIYYPGVKNILRKKDSLNTKWEIIASTDDSFWEVFGVRNSPNVLYATVFKKGGVYRSFNADSETPTGEILRPYLTEYKNGEDMVFWPSDLSVNSNEPTEFWLTYESYGSGWEKYPQPKVIYFNGAYWEDWTGLANGDETLKHLSVQEVIHQEGTKSRIFIGTNAGVFYKESKDEPWTKMHGLPHARVSELEINYSAQILVCGTYGRGGWIHDLPEPTETMKLRKDEEWENYSLVQDLVIKKGVQLTVLGELNVSKGVSIYIEPGARLILDGATVHNVCGLQWGGIQIEESNGFLFFKAKKGKLSLLNEAEVK